MLARALESEGIATTSISMVREHTEKVKPPRALFVPFPFGHALGRPDDPDLQHRVLRAALDLLAAPAGPVLRDFPDEAEPGGEPPAPVQASAITPAAAVPEDPALETAQMRQYHEQWLARSGGRSAFGVSGVPATRFRGVVRFLQAFAAGEDADMEERPADVPLPGFIRYCADDWKALYFEGRLAMKPASRGDEVTRWFWAETAAGQVLRRVRDRLDASEDPRWKAAAFGVAR
ncbi:MAG TPA: hypothetical protein VLK35_03050 [Methylomirabilota bacterium]|nr:hypothetical protein [Vicinamibacteria bacterium]HSE03109.1 hypothetical protein [Methylomirabilota bacterium]